MPVYQFHLQPAREMLHQPPAPAEGATSDEDTVPPPKSSKYDSANRLRGGFKFHHMLTYPATAKKNVLRELVDGAEKTEVAKTQDCTAKNAMCLYACFLASTTTILLKTFDFFRKTV